MNNLWQKAKTFAEEASKRTQTLTTSPSKIADIVSETAKRSKDFAAEASKKADELRTVALQQADHHIKSLTDQIQIQLPTLSLINSSADSPSDSELDKFGISEGLKEFVKGFTTITFQNFPAQDDDDDGLQASDTTSTSSNVRQDLTEWQQKHATLVLTTVKEISRLRYELCPRYMKDRRFWRVYFTLVRSHVAPYEKKYADELNVKEVEQKKDDKIEQTPPIAESEVVQTKLKSKSSSSSAEQDLDSFLLGDLDDGDSDPGEDGDMFDDDFDKIDNLDIEDEKSLKNKRLYYQCIPEGKEYPVFCRKLATEGNSWFKNIINFAKQGFVSEQILLDFNQIAEQHGYVDVGTCRPSPDNRYLAYTLDTTGNERYILQIKDLQKNCILIKEINNVVNLAWAKDSCTLFYTVSDENQNQRPYKVQLTKLGSDDDDVIIYTENDSRFCVDITCTKDGEFVTVNSNSRTSSQVYVINANKPLSGLRIFHKRVPGVRCFVEHHRGFFYIMTNAPVDEKNLTSGNYYLARCRVEDVESNIWQIIIPPGEDVSLQDMDMFNEHIVLFVNKNGSPTICSIKLPIDLSWKKDIMNIDNLDPWYFPVPSDSCTIVPGYNHNFMSSVYRAVVSSPVMPDITVDYDMSQNTSNLVQQEDVEVISSDDEGGEGELMEFSDEYACERKEVISHDGVRIPLTIMYSRKMCQKGKSPGLLHGYGAYGEVLEKDWCPNRFSLLAAGWVFAFADVRGGSGVDPCWHKNGSGLNKIKSIKDFVSCGEYLINEGYVHKYRLGAIGHSAGGLLVGAAINMYPQLFRAAILKVPFLDICNTLLDPSLPLTILDYEEFGNPQLKSEFESILSYSPYDNIREGVCYPSMLVTSSLHDTRVGVWEGAKWVGKVRESTCTSCSSSVILKTNMSGGHFGEGGRFSQCHEEAFEYAFLIKVMAIYDAEK